MRTRTRLASLLAASAVAAAGCSKSSSDTTPPPPPDTARIASPVAAGTPRGITGWAQGVRAEDQGGELFPGHANTWEIGPDFALGTGYGLQFGFAMSLSAGQTSPPGSSDPAVVFTQLYYDWAGLTGTGLLNPFPFDQEAGELTYLSPVFASADGLVTAVVTTSIGTAPGNLPVATALEGLQSGFVLGTADSRLVRTVAVAAGQSYTLAWLEEVSGVADRFYVSDVPPYGPVWQVVLRNPATGAPIGDPLFVSTSTVFEPSAAHTVVFSVLGALTSVDLSFELRASARNDGAIGYASVDAVTLTTGGANLLSNGDFEQGLAGWRLGGGGQPQNARSAPRVVELDPAGAATVTITRAFYAPPAATWARYVDVFQNDHDAEVVTTVVYAALHSAGSFTGWSNAASGKAIVGRDTAGSVRDVGFVFGSGFSSWDPSATVPDLVFMVHKLQIPARGKVALVHFVVQLGQGADLTGADHATAGTDAECQKVVTGFRATDPTYRQDLEAGVLSIVKNL